MFHLCPHFLGTGVVSSVQPSRTTDTDGCWNLPVHKTEYNTACEKVRAVLNDYEHHIPNAVDRATWSYPRTVGGKNGAKHAFDDENSIGNESYGARSERCLDRQPTYS